MRALYIGWMLIWGMTAHAIELPEIPVAPSERLPVDTDEMEVPCDQILNRLARYNQMAREHDASVAGFLGEVTQRVTDWHSLLSPLEGTQTTIEPGTFSPLLKGAEEITNITNLAFDNSDLLAQELDKIIYSLEGCGVGSPPTPPFLRK